MEKKEDEENVCRRKMPWYRWSEKERTAREGEDDGSDLRIDALMIVQVVRESGRHPDAVQLVGEEGRCSDDV